MLRLSVVDVSAESRSRLAKDVSTFQESGQPELSLLPRISVQQLSPDEVKFHGAPDVCLIGEELFTADPGAIGRIRNLLPDTPIIVRIPDNKETLVTIEDLARLGADDIVTDKTDSLTFFKKIILLCRRPKKGKNGHLVVVDSAKGGLGVTSVVAGLAESAVLAGKKVAILDFDLETQDLSRFLQSRPFINENLDLLLERTRPVTEEFVKQCLIPIWGDDGGLFVMSPAALHDESVDYGSEKARVYLSILEILDAQFDLVIVDVGSVAGSLLKTLYRVADKVVMLVTNDPACLYSTVSRIGTVRGFIAPTAQIIYLENASTKHGLPRDVLVREINVATKSTDLNWASRPIPFCKVASRWPGSGDTLLSRGGRSLVKALTNNSLELGISGESPERSPSDHREWGIFDAVVSKFKNRLVHVPGAKTATTSPMKALDTSKLIPFKDRKHASSKVLNEKPAEKTAKAEKAEMTEKIAEKTTLDCAEDIFEKLVAKGVNQSVSESELAQEIDNSEELFKKANIT